jgi:hypothetical protein
MSALRVSLFTWAALLPAGIGPCLLVWDLTTHPKGQQGNLPGFVLGLAAGGVGAVAGGTAGLFTGLWADRRARRLGLSGRDLDWPTAVVGSLMALAFLAFAVWYVWAFRKAWDI